MSKTNPNKNDHRPLRKCVRVIVRKGNKIFLGKRLRKNGEFICYDFIGGGVEENETMEEAVTKECLEEIGIRVHNIHALRVVDAQYFVLPNPERAKIYAGGEDHYFLADYLCKDDRLHGKEGDAMPYLEVTPAEAIELIKNGPASDYNPARLEALTKVKRWW